MNDQSAAGLAAQFKPDFAKIINEVKEVATNPVGCWSSVRGTYSSVKEFYLNFFGPLSVLPPVIGFIKGSIIGITLPFTDQVYRAGLGVGLVSAVVQFLVALGMAYVTAIILGKVAAKFQGTDDLLAALKLVGYASSPSLVASVVTIVPFLGGLIAALVALYTIYIFFQGISPMLSVPAEQRIKFTAVSVVVIIVANILVSIVCAGIIGGAAIGAGI